MHLEQAAFVVSGLFTALCLNVDVAVGVLDAVNSTNDSSGQNCKTLHLSMMGNVTIDEKAYKISSDMNVTKSTENICEVPSNTEDLTQTQLIDVLTAPCRYDRLERPSVLMNGSVVASPLSVFVRVYIYVLQNLDSSDLQFKMHGLMQLRYTDPRLAFKHYTLARTQPLLGETSLRDMIWVPHVFLANEHDSSVLGTSERDVLVSISPHGSVIISSRIQATLYCWMNLQKFPFDEQYCPTILESWMYNASELTLHWEQTSPVSFDPHMHMTEYALENAWTNESVIQADANDMRHGAFAGNYSSLVFTVHLTREVGYYVMDYFLPSIMIVAISWVTFWLQADQTPARTTLGCTTMLSFITLASSQENNLPKVSYIKVSEVWFLGCTFFIFGSLVEFAFVNTIWRRNHSVEVKKVKGKYILKSTLTPRMKRHKMIESQPQPRPAFDRFLSVDSPVVITVEDDRCNAFTSSESITTSSMGGCANDLKPSDNANPSWSTMTPHEVSLWIDRKSRFLFPTAFIVFNAFFWTFVYCL